MCTIKNGRRKILLKVKENREQNSKSDVYKINCNDCRAVHYDQMENSFNMGVNEHAKSISKGSASTRDTPE